MKHAIKTRGRRPFKATAFYGLVVSVFLVAGCAKEGLQEQDPTAEGTASAALVSGRANFVHEANLPEQTLWELQQTRAATARYRHIKNAIKDGYADIDVVIPGMGHHYMKADLLDATFDIRHPEILVYEKAEDGSFELVAAEYAVPLNLSATAPAGFTGTADVWNRNTGFGLWLLHAWVWRENPDGVFNATNSTVHTH